ncbi:hypothetical protein VTI74DRAFT_1091 [Chaetomium olivicolor]
MMQQHQLVKFRFQLQAFDIAFPSTIRHLFSPSFETSTKTHQTTFRKGGILRQGTRCSRDGHHLHLRSTCDLWHPSPKLGR